MTMSKVRAGQRKFRSAVLALAAVLASGAPAVLAQPAAPALAPQAVQLSPEQLIAAADLLARADEHGLSPAAYLPARLREPGALPGPEDHAAVVAGLLRYARDVHVGRMDASEFPKIWQLRPDPYDPTGELSRALASGRLEPWLESLAPRYSGYAALKKGLTKYRQIAANGGWTAIPEGPDLALGASGPRVAALRARLVAEDPAAHGPAVFDTSLQQAVVRAQKRYGMKPDGIVGKPTLAALNVPAEQRVQQIVANMERWRWMPQKMPATRVQVNSGAAIVTLFRDDKPVLSMKAVSGKPGDETPMLVSEIHSVVLNPPWNVPTSIASEELWPKERKNPGYLERAGYRVISTEGGSRLQQRPGPDSALGLYKFDFENPFAVYLHDTPAKTGFERVARQASHGCVRIEKPAELARALLAGDPKWTPEAIADAVAGGETQRVRLPSGVPVYILYWTAFAGADGQMNFRTDPYGWDKLLLQKVGALGSGKQVVARN
ncbi:L,D-transpeptidase family protein [Phenylobacterium sp.]|jgi:murein L,D-transpeptidase YcbB/YkuD|uniref:L,D-transpeptidase family protein n=1 Tax=Phenylobacterium sp. TaxID=1871053 RepID=UPI002F9587EF